jgi:AAHS family benzoate transporter-like MFS transporter
LILAWFLALVDGFDNVVLGAVGPSLLGSTEWDVDKTTLGMIGSVSALGMPVGALAAGWVADRYGRRLPLVVSVVWISIAMVAAGVAPTLESFIVARTLTCVAVGALLPVLVAMTADNAKPARRSLTIGVVMTGLAAGGLLSSLLGAILLPVMHFQVLFVIGGVASLTLLPFLWHMVPHSVVATVAPLPPERRVGGSSSGLRALLRPPLTRTAVILWIAAFCGYIVVTGATTWLPSLMFSAGFDISSALQFAVAFNVGAIIGALTVTFAADLSNRLVATTAACFILSAAAMLAISTQPGRVLTLTLCGLAGFGTLGTTTLVNALATRLFPLHLRGISLGSTNAAARVGAIVAPAYIGLVIGALAFGAQSGFYAIVVPAVMAAACLPFIRPRCAPDLGEANDRAVTPLPAG